MKPMSIVLPTPSCPNTTWSPNHETRDTPSPPISHLHTSPCRTSTTGRRLVYAEIFLDDALKYGHASPDTLKFWMGQSDEARQFLTNNDGKVTLREALRGLDSFIGHQSESDQRRDVYVWGNDDKFDMGNLEAMYRALNMPYPWNYGRSQNVRTIVWAARTFAGVDRPKMRQGRTAHNAVDDAIHRAEYVTDMVKAILAGGKRDGDDR